MKINVLKFGGTSVGSIEKIQSIAKKLVNRKKQGENLVVVVSAMGKRTDELLNMAKLITPNPDKRELDMLLSTGEQVTIALLSMAINALACKSISMTGSQVSIKTDSTHSKARINSIDKDNMLNYLSEDRIIVVAGFQGVTDNGDITTLGRGGSDTTAVSLAAILNASCEIYTDVDGVYSIDPRKYPKAKKLESLDYDEMLEMASLGAGIIDVRAIEMAHKYKVPIFIGLNTMDVPGTIVKEYDDNMEKKAVTGMSINENILMVSVSDIPFDASNVARIFSKIANKNIIVDMISQTAPHNNQINISFTVEKDDLYDLEAVLIDLKEEMPSCDFSFNDELIKLSVVGVGMISQSGVASKLFDVFSENNIHFYQVTTSEISISYTVHSDDLDRAINVIAKVFKL
ncbi:MAG: aspartate kinase [Clostridiales bacterium]|nr:aspartate kinase [Clostridiales bacterium]